MLVCSELDPGLEEAISTILWVAPRLSADVQELREVCIIHTECKLHTQSFAVIYSVDSTSHG